MTGIVSRLIASVAACATIAAASDALVSGLSAAVRGAHDKKATASLADEIDAGKDDLANALQAVADKENEELNADKEKAAESPPPAPATAQPVKVLGQEGLAAPNVGSATFDPPAPSSPNPFDDDKTMGGDKRIEGETATNVANPPSDETIAQGLEDASGAPAQPGLSDKVDTGAPVDAATSK